MARSGVPIEGAPDQVINSDRVAVFGNIVHARRQNEWINAKENGARKQKVQQKEQRRVERAPERQKRAREGGKDADLRE